MNQEEGYTHSLKGRWEGSFKSQSQKVNLVVDFSANTISIPQQGLQNYPLEDLNYNAPLISFTLALGGMVQFTGERVGNTIQGTFRQPGSEGTFELTFARQNLTPSVVLRGNGVHDITEPGLPVACEEVILNTGSGILYGTLTLPDRKGPVLVVLIIPGSGPTDRDGNSPLLPGKNNSLKMLANGLAGYGIAAIRYDKRGIAASAKAGKKESSLTFDSFVDDAVAWIEKLKDDPRFSGRGIIGHSEGSLIGMIAAHRANIQALVSIAGPGQSIYEILLDQLRARLPGYVEEATRIIGSLRQGKQVADVSQPLQSLFRPSVQPFLISMSHFNPAEEISRINISVLIINGSRDLQTNVNQARLLATAQKKATLRIIDGMNHVLKDAPLDPQGNIATYSNPELPLAKGLMETVGSFLQIHLQSSFSR